MHIECGLILSKTYGYTIECGHVDAARAGAQTYKYRVAQKSKPLPNYQKIVLNCIKACQ